MQMDTKRLTLKSDNFKSVARITSEFLKKGKTCVIPTDTVYGIVALDSIFEAVDRVYSIKKRTRDKPFIRLVGSFDLVREYTDHELPDPLKPFWPGPLTIVFEGRDVESIALRYPDHPFLNELFAVLGNHAIVAPSANISGTENLSTCDELVKTFLGVVDLIVCSSEDTAGRLPSTIIDITRTPWRVIREGSVKVHL
jgi:L-threonylcarbamoyladenylate synthase